MTPTRAGSTSSTKKDPEKDQQTTTEAGSGNNTHNFDALPPVPMKAFAKLPGWKALRSMRTAIWLLLALAIATFIPTWVPQRITNQTKVQEFAEDHPSWFQAFDRLRLFDVFDSWWYIGIYGTLLFVLVNCLVPRTRNFFRQQKQAFATPRERKQFPSLPCHVEMQVPLSPEETVSLLKKTLRSHRFRQGNLNTRGQWVAEKGHLREGGSLVFHWSFFVLLLGMFFTRAFGFEGQVLLVEGEHWVDAPVNYDYYNPGRFFGPEDHRGFEIAHDSFEVRFFENGGPADFVSTVRVFDDTNNNAQGEKSQVLQKEIRVNNPLDYRGMKFYQISWGWAIRVTIDDQNGKPLFDDWVPLFPGGARNTWTGVVKLPSLSPQVGMELFFFPDALLLGEEEAADLRGDFAGGENLLIRLFARPGPPTIGDAVLLAGEYAGDLGQNTLFQTVYDLRTENMEGPLEYGLARLSNTGYRFADGLSLHAPEIRHYSVLRVKRDPGLWTVLIAAVLLMFGLTASLYISRRRLWVWVRPVEPDPSDTNTATAASGTDTKETAAPRTPPPNHNSTPSQSGEKPTATATESTTMSPASPLSQRNDVLSQQHATEAAAPRTPQTMVTLGGLAYQRKDAFETEFTRLVKDLQAKLRSNQAHGNNT